MKISKKDQFLDPHCDPLDAPLMLLNQFNCLYVCFTLRASVTAVPTASTNAFDVLMQQSRELHLPSEVSGPNVRGDQKVRKELLKVLHELKVGWSPSSVESAGKQLVWKLAATLWYVDCHHGSFLAQGIRIPSPFSQFQGYNDLKSREIKKPKLSKEGLSEHMQSLSGLLCQPWFSRPRFSVLHDNVDKLVEAMHLYVLYLDRHNQKVQAQHHSPSAVQQPDNFSELRTIPSRQELCNSNTVSFTKLFQACLFTSQSV